MPDTVTHVNLGRRRGRPERPAVAPGLRALCFGAAYGLVIGVLVGLAL